MKETPIVSIKCLVYNHELYLRECLNGFVMQKTSFKFEAIVHDDASTDGSAAIIREYAEKYPDIIKPIYEEENQYSKHDGSLAKIMNDALNGKYIALCEGDDYWTDPLKLQKQVDFLESHKAYSMCFHKAKVIREEGIDKHANEGLYQNLEQREYSGEEILANWTVPTASTLYRNIKRDNFPEDTRFIYGDIILFLWLCDQGKIYCLDEVMSVYRINVNGAAQKKVPFDVYFNHHKAIEEHYDHKYRTVFSKLIGIKCALRFIYGKSGKERLLVLIDVIKHPKQIPMFLFYFFKFLSEILVQKFQNHKK